MTAARGRNPDRARARFAHPIVGEAARLVLVPLIETGTADRGLAVVAAALRAMSQTSAEAFADSSRHQELFAQHVKTWSTRSFWSLSLMRRTG